jgi:hypothetical protein
VCAGAPASCCRMLAGPVRRRTRSHHVVKARQFMIEKPGGVRAVTDYNGVTMPAEPPYIAVTVQNSYNLADPCLRDIQSRLKGIKINFECLLLRPVKNHLPWLSIRIEHKSHIVPTRVSDATLHVV